MFGISFCFCTVRWGTLCVCSVNEKKTGIAKTSALASIITHHLFWPLDSEMVIYHPACLFYVRLFWFSICAHFWRLPEIGDDLRGSDIYVTLSQSAREFQWPGLHGWIMDKGCTGRGAGIESAGSARTFTRMMMWNRIEIQRFALA